jgi:hypothetical protein
MVARGVEPHLTAGLGFGINYRVSIKISYTRCNFQLQCPYPNLGKAKIVKGVSMISKEDLNQLAEKTYEESDLLDYKQKYSPHKKTAFWAEAAKDIVSFANTRGGILVFGLDD